MEISAGLEGLPEPGRSHVIALIRQLDAQTRLRRPATMLEAGNLFAFLASDQASWTPATTAISAAR